MGRSCSSQSPFRLGWESVALPAEDERGRGQKMMPMVQQIEKNLQEAFEPLKLRVEDVSEQHRGHAGFQEGGESHFEVEIQSPTFKGMSRVAQHRAVHAALGDGIIGKIHALGLKIYS